MALAKCALGNLGRTPQGEHIKTGDIRALSARLYRGVKGEPKDIIFALCGELLETGDWPMRVIAFDFAYRMKRQYDNDTFALFESWLVKYVRGWGACDDFCTHALGELICQNTALAAHTAAWASRDEFWMRRAAAVVLIPSIWQDKYGETRPLEVSDSLMEDKHDLVRKGYGWMLKTLSAKEPELVFEYLLKNKARMPGVSFRYAMEKMDNEKKRLLMEKVYDI